MLLFAGAIFHLKSQPQLRKIVVMHYVNTTRNLLRTKNPLKILFSTIDRNLTSSRNIMEFGFNSFFLIRSRVAQRQVKARRK